MGIDLCILLPRYCAVLYVIGVAVVKATMIYQANKGKKADEAVGFVDALV